MRLVVVFSSALVGCRVASSFDIGISVGVVNSIGHLLVGAIVFDYRRGTSCENVSIGRWWAWLNMARLTAQRLARVALVSFLEGHCCCGG